MAEYSKAQLTEMIVGKLRRNFGRDVEDAGPNHIFKACALVLRDIMSAHQMETGNRVWEDQQRQVHYLSMEFLMGRSLEKNAYNLGLLDTLKETLEDLGYSASDLFEKVSSEVCPNPALIIDMGAPLSLANVAQVCRAV